MLLTEFDANKEAVINPGDLIAPIAGFPEVFVSCFSSVTFSRILNNYDHREIASVNFANLAVPVYKINYRGKAMGLVNAYVGAAGAVGLFEELIAMGMKKLLIFGTCGVLDASIKHNTIIVPTAALRDEGTSCHYMPCSDEMPVNNHTLSAIDAYLRQHGIKTVTGKVWTTDAFYRETKAKLQRRKEAGCIAVDMECSALAALAWFRGIDLIHFFYAADNLDTDEWDERSLSNYHSLDEKDNIALIALDMAYSIMIQPDTDGVDQ